MRFQHKWWIPVSWALAAANLGAIWFAAADGEAAHATGHGVLAVLLTLGAKYLADRRARQVAGPDLQAALDDNDELRGTVDSLHGRLAELEERVEFSERLLAERREVVSPIERP